MNQSKTYCLYALLLALALNQSAYATTTKKLATITTEQEEVDDLATLFDDEPDEIDNAETQKLVERTHLRPLRADSCSPQQSIDFLFDLVPNLDKILQEDLYCHTNPINKRSLLDLPLFLSHHRHQPHPWYASVDIFWNESNRANFTKHSNRIASYLALDNEKLLQMLPTTCDEYALNVFPLLAKGRLEERRFGSMLQAGYAWKRLTLRSMVPLYYNERNFQLDQEDKDALMVQFDETTQDEQERFQKNHLISDQLGFGDLRLYADVSVCKRPTFRLNAGPLVTVPTAFALVTGIKGSRFKPVCPRPTINFQEICACIDTEMMTNLGLQALDSLSAVILNEQLGNRRHVGIGGFADWENNLSSIIHRPWTERIRWQNYVSFEYLMPSNERRFFVKQANAQDYNKRDFHDEAQATDNLHFLETELINTVFPFNFKTRVNPGYVLWWDSQCAYQGKHLGGSCGLDFWLQGKEKLTNIQTCSLPIEQFGVSTAHAPLAYQVKVVGSFSYTVTRPNHLWIFGVGADKTFLRAGIGKDYTATAFLRASF